MPVSFDGANDPSANIFTRLLKNRVVMLGTDVNDDIANQLKEEEKEYTALLIQYASPIAAAILPRYVNNNSAMQAASPAYETARLFSIIGVGVDVLRGFALVLVFSAGLSVFIALYNALNERRYDLAVRRNLILIGEDVVNTAYDAPVDLSPRAQIEALSSTDALTGLLNRRGFSKRLDRQIAAVKKVRATATADGISSSAVTRRSVPSRRNSYRLFPVPSVTKIRSSPSTAIPK